MKIAGKELKFSSWFWVEGKRNRKSYFGFMFLGLFALWGLLKLMGVVGQTVIIQILLLWAHQEGSCLLLDIIAYMFIFWIGYLLWFLFCNSVKRLHDIGMSTRWAVVFEAVRCSIILNTFFVESRVLGKPLMFPRLLDFVVIFVPLFIGLIEGKEEEITDVEIADTEITEESV